MAKKAKIKTFRFDAAASLDTPDAVAEYLAAALETNDAAYIAKSIGTAARAIGMSEIARRSGLSRENLYRALDGETKVEFDTIARVLSALGVRLTVLRSPAVSPRGETGPTTAFPAAARQNQRSGRSLPTSKR